MLSIRMKIIKAEFITNEKENNEAGAYPECESKYVNEGVDLITGYIAPCNEKVAF